jgi:hypothetical protein
MTGCNVFHMLIFITQWLHVFSDIDRVFGLRDEVIIFFSLLTFVQLYIHEK